MKVRLSASFIENLKPDARKHTYYDSVTQYLSLIVLPSGSRTFYYIRRIGGALQSYRLGKAAEMPLDLARRQAGEISRRIAAGMPVMDASPVQNPDLAGIWQDYIAMRTARGDRERSLSISRRRFEMYVPAELARLDAAVVTRKRLQDLTFAVGEASGKRSATLLMIDLRAAYNYAKKTGTITCDNPASSLTLFANVERERFMLDAEARRFFAALKQAENPNFRDFVMLAILTGKRKNEILRMKWDQVDLEQRLLAVPRENAKNKRPDLAVLDQQAVDILLERKKRAETARRRSSWVFSADTPCGHYSAPEKAFRALLARAEIPDFRIHDLRRTLGSYMAANNASLHMIADALGQSSTAATHIYARIPTAAKREAVSAAVETITRLADGKRNPRAELDRLLDQHPELVPELLEIARKKA